MCYQPIKIRNNSRSFVSGAYPLYNNVPCGHCAECHQSVVDDWLVRLYYEWKYNTEVNKGVSFFVTLTYNNDEIPRYEVNDKDTYLLRSFLQRYSLRSQECALKMQEFFAVHKFLPTEYDLFSHQHFDITHISKCMKSLRQLFNNDGLLPYDSSSSLKFFCVSEYGSEHKRPHYHLFVFVPFQISADSFKRYMSSAWSHRVLRKDLPQFMVDRLLKRSSLRQGVTILSSHKDWNDWILRVQGKRIYTNHIRGSVRYSKKYLPEITSPAGIEYVCKYVHKKDKYLSEPKFKRLQDFLNLFPKSKDDYQKNEMYIYNLVKTLRSYFPIVHTSNYLGISILNEFECLSDDEIVKMINSNPLSVDSLPRTFKVPTYIVNRIMYNKDCFDNSLRVLSDIGKKSLEFRLACRIDSYERYMHDIETAYMRVLEPSEIKELKKKFPNIDYCAYQSAFRIDYRCIAMFKYVFYNVEMPLAHIPSDLSCQDVFDNFKDSIMFKRINREYDSELPPKFDFPRAVALRSKNTWNFYPCFCGFTEIINAYDEIKKLVDTRHYASKAEQERKNDELRLFLNESRYRFENH